MANTKDGTDWLRKLVAYLQRHMGAATAPPSNDPVPAEWVGAPPATKDAALAIHGSENQKWLTVACGLLSGDPRWVAFALDRYDRERKMGHRLSEVRTPSHAWQHLTAHVSIRHSVQHSKALAVAAGPAGMGALSVASGEWWRDELWMLARFWSPAARHVVGVGARAQPPQNWPTDSQDDDFAAYAVGANSIKQPKTKGWTDTWCQEVAQLLISNGDDLGRSRLHEVPRSGPKLWAPIHVSTSGLLRSWWAPGPDVLAPSYRAEVDADGQPHFWYTASVPEDGNSAAFEELGR